MASHAQRPIFTKIVNRSKKTAENGQSTETIVPSGFRDENGQHEKSFGECPLFPRENAGHLVFFRSRTLDDALHLSQK